MLPLQHTVSVLTSPGGTRGNGERRHILYIERVKIHSVINNAIYVYLLARDVTLSMMRGLRTQKILYLLIYLPFLRNEKDIGNCITI